ncbi:hypothetical protein EJ06DRAFT_469410, partial [Trichodelitschia bisporula]
MTSFGQTSGKRRQERHGGRRAYSQAPGRLRNSTWSSVLLPLFLLALLSRTTEAVYVAFENCLDRKYLTLEPKPLQFVPYFVNAKFNNTDEKHNLNITIYGNVTGNNDAPYRAPSDPRWKNDNDTYGKIVGATKHHYTTLFTNVDVLTYSSWDAPASSFCNATRSDDDCPWGPLFDGNSSDPNTLHSFSVGHDFFGAYSFSTMSTTVRVKAGDDAATSIACISFSITPDIGGKLSAALTYIPVAILVLVAIATLIAATLSPWSSSDFFYWTSNYGRNDEILRLITPGFGDCLHYIQFIVLAGSLSLDYPGFFQPVVSHVSWSALMFNESFVSNGNGTRNLIDGMYIVNGTYGLERMSQLVGISEPQDIWAGMIIWMCVIIAIVVGGTQIGFATSWFHRMLSEKPQEDFRSKNLPLTLGHVVRVVFNYFLLPLVSLSMFQMVVAPHSSGAVVGMAVVLLVVVICSAAWIFRLIFTTRPRVHLFDHLPLLLAYGPLYNTYSDEAAPFAFIPVLLTFVRGIAIGAVQPSGIAQLVVLAVCEVVMILTLHAFRPFRSLTSMNAYHTFFSAIRLASVLLCVAFVPSLGVSEASRGWIGYVILLLHAIVLVFGFFLNAVQTIIEIFARRAGAGRDTQGGLSAVFGVRQLSKRNRKHGARSEAESQTEKSRSLSMGNRVTSLSASSVMMLNSPDQRGSGNFDHLERGSLASGTSPGTSTLGPPQSPFSFVPPGSSHRRPTLISKAMEPTDPFYRPPRTRKQTLESIPSASPPHAGQELPDSYFPIPQQPYAESVAEGSINNSISAAYMRDARGDSDSNLSEQRKFTDYAVRESDFVLGVGGRDSNFYYGVRGPALSSTPSRRRRTGPADPMNPVASATGWFKGLMGGKRKEKTKGFEVVRSTRMQLIPQDDDSPPIPQEPYTDSP